MPVQPSISGLEATDPIERESCTPVASLGNDEGGRVHAARIEE